MAQKLIGVINYGNRGPKGEDGTVSWEELTPEQRAQLKGDKGDTGDVGPKGDKGDTGPQGIQGLQGIQGERGPQGLRGEQGPTGQTGPTGATGPQGPRGFQGETGQTGPAGATGPQGPQGPQGPRGLTGPQGLTGERGPQGLKGDKGDTGARGEKGEKGDKGDKGDVGATGATGAQGPRGFTGAQGPKGDKGDRGPQGYTGPQGPQGQQGPKGEKGEKGDTGPQGPQGPQGVMPQNYFYLYDAEDRNKLTYYGSNGISIVNTNIQAAPLFGVGCTDDGQTYFVHNSDSVSTNLYLNDIAQKSEIPSVSVSDTGTSTDEVSYITINGVEKKLAGGSDLPDCYIYNQNIGFQISDSHGNLLVDFGIFRVWNENNSRFSDRDVCWNAITSYAEGFISGVAVVDNKYYNLTKMHHHISQALSEDDLWFEYIDDNRNLSHITIHKNDFMDTSKILISASTLGHSVKLIYE